MGRPAQLAGQGKNVPYRFLVVLRTMSRKANSGTSIGHTACNLRRAVRAALQNPVYLRPKTTLFAIYCGLGRAQDWADLGGNPRFRPERVRAYTRVTAKIGISDQPSPGPTGYAYALRKAGNPAQTEVY
jgi:hypothetical protein